MMLKLAVSNLATFMKIGLLTLSKPLCISPAIAGLSLHLLTNMLHAFDSKNCEGNPNCYNYLGEKTWIEKNPDEDLKDAVTETSTGLREPVSFHFLNYYHLLKIFLSFFQY